MESRQCRANAEESHSGRVKMWNEKPRTQQDPGAQEAVRGQGEAAGSGRC